MISPEETKHIAGLARIGVTQEEIGKFSQDLSAILDWIEEIKKADLREITAMTHITGLKNRLREDVSGEFENKAALVKLFPESKNGYDQVKSVL